MALARPRPADPTTGPPGADADRRTPTGPATTVLSAAALARTIDRMAHQILERHGDDPVVLLGIPTRGVDLARRLGDRMRAFADDHRDPSGRVADAGVSGSGGPAVGALDITLYRDDLRRRPPRALEETSIPGDGVDDAVVILVDDVLFSGRTVRAALDALRDHGRPAVVQLAVLVDRGHRQLPIRADYVGKNIPTALGDDVSVRVASVDGVDEVVLTRAAGTAAGPAGPDAAGAGVGPSARPGAAAPDDQVPQERLTR
ncbi:bifunctional pyr operon transcriptional regulator/uracil phosphoribosyltransferase PyrR [Nakamurella leprariae]|uniref:Bifunctional protein PyrR n=1 Tax=Nakamurella leprariae TaxID=2803911 RepID=A0A939BZZ3_9ACTN|nr:bifunctional pyr operon transcriptional regulator/uracil phosphoribosyltransferase PyrR [Nakamurella leprariae]MBM9468236.1 bifunctional pyr operon transcriptional regulator/uracil phosphoribosyltransferase PyrR [Nakamurella leprariae]